MHPSLPWGQTSSGAEPKRADTPLPGVYDRETILRRLDEELARARREDAPLSIALLQIEGPQDGEQPGGCEVRDAMLHETVRRLIMQEGKRLDEAALQAT